MDAITLGLWSYHFNRDLWHNETHNLIGLQYESAYIAHYDNSYGKDSVILSWVSDQSCYGRFCMDWMAGVVTGYEYRTDMKATPFVMPRFKLYLAEKVNVYSMLIPGEVVAAGFEVRF